MASVRYSGEAAIAFWKIDLNHIVFVAKDGPHCFEGPTVNAARLLPELSRRGVRVTALLVTEGDDLEHGPGLRASGVECRVLPRRGYAENLAHLTLTAVEELRPSVFVPNIWIPGCVAARWVREAGVPTVAAYRSDDPFYEGIIDQFVLGDPLWAVSGLVCVSADLEDRVRRRSPLRTLTTVIPSGVMIPEKAHVHGDEFRIAYVGRFVQKQKRVLDVARAIIEALERIPHATATFFGHGPERGRLKTLVEGAAPAQRIEIAGTVSPQSIQNRLQSFDVIVLLSDYEGTPGALMDAMACGVVPICSDISGGVRELIRPGETGILAADRGHAVVDTLLDLDRNPDHRAEIGRRAREHIANRFSLNRCADLWEALCERLISEAGPSKSLVVPARISLPEVAPTLAPHLSRKPPLLKRLYGGLKRRLN